MIGRFQKNPEIAPQNIIKHLTKQLSSPTNNLCFKYSERKNTIIKHNKSVRDFLGIQFLPTSYHEKLINYLIAKAPDPGHYLIWIKLSEKHLRGKKYILPSMNVLRRIVMSARNKGLETVSNKIWIQLTDEKIESLDKMLDDNTSPTWNQYTNKRFYKASSKKVNEILGSINGIRNLGLDLINFDGINESYIKYFAQRGIRMSGGQLRDQSKKSRYVLMVITLNNLLSELTDISIQMNDEIISEVFLTGESKSNDYFRKNKNTVKSILSAFHFVSGTLLDDKLTGSEKLGIISSKIPEDKMEELNSNSASLDIPRGTEKLYFASNSYQKIQKYLPLLIETFKLSSMMKNDPLIKASDYYLDRKNEGLSGIGQDAPTDFIIKKNWEKIVFDKDGSIKTKPWIVCLADCMRSSLRRGAIKVEGTKQYKSLDSDLISWKEFKKLKIIENKNLPFTSTAQTVTNSIGKAIHDLSDKEDEWKENDTASIDNEGKIHFRRLDKLDVPETANQLRSILYGSFKERPFSDVLAEADGLTGYTSQLTKLSSGMPIRSTETKLGCALYSVLYAAACNIPLTKMSASVGIPLDFLVNLRDEVIRPQTIQAATAELVDFYSRLPLAQILGSGASSSSDGQGVIVEGDPLGSRFNRKLFKKNTRGFIIYTHILDNYAPFFTQLFPAIPREAPYVADGLLYNG